MQPAGPRTVLGDSKCLEPTLAWPVACAPCGHRSPLVPWRSDPAPVPCVPPGHAMQGVFRFRLCPLAGGQGPFLSEVRSPCLLHRGHSVGGRAQGPTGLRGDPGRKSTLQAVAVCLLRACVASLFLVCLVTLAPSFLALDFLGPLYTGAVPSVVSMWSLQGPSPCLGGRGRCRAPRAAVHPHSHFSPVLPLSPLRTRAG